MVPKKWPVLHVHDMMPAQHVLLGLLRISSKVMGQACPQTHPCQITNTCDSLSLEIYIHAYYKVSNQHCCRVKLKIQLLKAQKPEGNSEHINQTCCFKPQMKIKEEGR